MSGMSRSGAIVLSYLMIKRGMSVMDAVKLVRDKREIFPNDGFLKQLCELDQQLQQQRWTNAELQMVIFRLRLSAIIFLVRSLQFGTSG